MILRLLGFFQIAGCLYLAYLRPEYRSVAFLFAFLALLGLIAAFRAQTLAEALRTQEEKLVKRVLRRINVQAIVSTEPLDFSKVAPIAPLPTGITSIMFKTTDGSTALVEGPKVG